MALTTPATNIMYTVLILINQFFFGITLNAMWPALVDLSYIYKVEHQKSIIYAASFSAFGYLIGTLSGITYKWINRQLLLFFMLSMTSILIGFLPFYGTLTKFFAAITFAGIGLGSWDSSNTLWLVEMWPKRQASILQTQQLIFGLGSITSAGVLSMFVIGDKNDTTNNSTITIEDRQNSLKIPCIIFGILQIIVPIIFFILFFIKKYQKNYNYNNKENNNNDEEKTSKPIRFKMIKLILAAMILAIYTSGEQGYFFFSDTMLQYWEPKMKSSDSATVLATLAASYTIGRLLTTFITIYIKPDIVMVYHYIIIIISFVWLYLMHDSRICVYLSTALLGYGFSAMWPAIVSFAENHLQLTEITSSFMFFCTGLTAIFTPLLIANKLDSHPLILIQFTSIYIGINILLFIILNLLIYFV